MSDFASLYRLNEIIKKLEEVREAIDRNTRAQVYSSEVAQHFSTPDDAMATLLEILKEIPGYTKE